jgi:hypothetical protein
MSTIPASTFVFIKDSFVRKWGWDLVRFTRPLEALF